MTHPTTEELRRLQATAKEGATPEEREEAGRELAAAMLRVGNHTRARMRIKRKPHL